MSLIRPVIRMCAKAALTGKTWAEARVYDSDNRPLAEALQSETKPYIVIYTDEDNRLEIEGRDLYASTRNLSLVLEIGVASTVTVDGQTRIEIPATDEGMEFAVDVVEGQALAALLGDPKNPWAELLKRIILRVVRVPSQRGSSAERGSRWAARQVVLVCDVISDPPPGTVVADTHVLRDFIKMAKVSTPSMNVAAGLLEIMIDRSSAPDWQQAQAWLVLTKKGIEALGQAPIISEELRDDWPPVLQEVTLTDHIHVVLEACDLEVEPPEIGSPTVTVP